MDKNVVKALEGMGLAPKSSEEKSRERERGRVSLKVATLLEEMGVKYNKVDIQRVDEDSPLNMPGSAPAVNPGGKGGAPTVQTKTNPQTPNVNPADPNKPPVKKPNAAPKVQLRQDASAGAGASSLKDLSDQLTGVTQAMKTIDLLIQSFSEAGDNDQSIESNRDALKAVMMPFFKKVDALRRTVES